MDQNETLLKTTYKDGSSACQPFNEKNIEVKTRLANLQKGITKIEKVIGTELKNTVEEVLWQTAELSAVEGTLAEKEAEIAASQEKISAVEGTLAEKEAEIAALKAQLEAASKKGGK